MDIYTVVLAEQVKRDLFKVPIHIARKLQAWIEAVEHQGLMNIRKIPGYRDEPLKRKAIWTTFN